MLLKKVRETIKEHQLLHPGDRIIVAVSGGIDSTVLLHVLHELQDEYSLVLHVFHLNHLFREESAEEDAQFVCHLSRSLGIPVTIKTFNVPKYCKERGLNAQEGARFIRYSLLQQQVEESGFHRVALGHQANDQGETILLHLLRGSGLDGLCGMKPRQGLYIRPLLSIFRQEIVEYSAQNNLLYREDPSNRKMIYQRNRLRMELIPHLEENYNPRFQEALLRMAELLQEDRSYLEKETAKVLPNVVQQVKNDEMVLFSTVLLDLPLALQRRILRRVYGLLSSCTDGLSFKQMERIRAFMTGGGRQLSLPKGIRVLKDYDSLIFTRRDPKKKSSYRLQLSVPGQIQLPGQDRIMKVLEVNKTLLEKIKAEPVLRSSLHRIFIDGDLVTPPFIVRSREDGDTFVPLGMAGRKKVKDFFIDAKISIPQRDEIPIVTDAQGVIIWIAGYRMAEKVKVTAATKRILELLLQ